MREENESGRQYAQRRGETSPHAWRKQYRDPLLECEGGNISTCVEKTRCDATHGALCRKHLHMREENRSDKRLLAAVEETSPHAWRKQTCLFQLVSPSRNISTCVEKTFMYSFRQCVSWKHLHIRGENHVKDCMHERHVETSPHTWRKHLFLCLFRFRLRNISTYVEKTPRRWS